jgi:anti-sigma factor RsiW
MNSELANCELAHERIVTAAYGELPDEQLHELERHVRNCADCRTEREQLLALKVLADAHPVVEPDANLVARSRQRLEEALDALPPKRWYEWLSQRTVNNFAALQAAPIAACLLLIVGAGVLGGYEVTQSRAAHAAAQPQAPVAPPAALQGAEIATISNIARVPNSEMVEVTYNQVVPQRLKGSLDDPAIRQLLMMASQNSESQSVRDDSVGLLVAECRAGHSCQATGVRDALMVLLRYDQDAGVRAKALQGLEPYVAEDVRVRDAVLEALLNDSDPRIRTSAIGILEPVESDTSVRQVLHSVANSDENPHIRTVSRQVLRRVAQFQ